MGDDSHICSLVLETGLTPILASAMVRDMGSSLFLPLVAIAASFVAAVLGLRAATVEVRDNQDEFINDLRRQGRWASLAALAAALSVVLQSIDRLMQ